MTALSQIIAIEKAVKQDSYREFTNIHQTMQKQSLLAGISRTYQPFDDDGDQLPPESTQVQIKSEDMLRKVATVLTRMFDVVATKDHANCTAKADIVVDGVVLVRDTPVTYLLFLEKQLKDLKTFVDKLIVLDPSDNWHLDEAKGVWSTDPVQTTKTKKIPRNHIKFTGDQYHPPQVEMYTEDVAVGRWTTTKFSGALPAPRVEQIARRIEVLTQAVVFAREQANTATVEDRKSGSAIFDYLFGT